MRRYAENHAEDILHSISELFLSSQRIIILSQGARLEPDWMCLKLCCRGEIEKKRASYMFGFAFFRCGTRVLLPSSGIVQGSLLYWEEARSLYRLIEPAIIQAIMPTQLPKSKKSSRWIHLMEGGRLFVRHHVKPLESRAVYDIRYSDVPHQTLPAHLSNWIPLQRHAISKIPPDCLRRI